MPDPKISQTSAEQRLIERETKRFELEHQESSKPHAFSAQDTDTMIAEALANKGHHAWKDLTAKEGEAQVRALDEKLFDLKDGQSFKVGNKTFSPEMVHTMKATVAGDGRYEIYARALNGQDTPPAMVKEIGDIVSEVLDREHPRHRLRHDEFVLKQHMEPSPSSREPLNEQASKIEEALRGFKRPEGVSGGHDLDSLETLRAIQGKQMRDIENGAKR